MVAEGIELAYTAEGNGPPLLVTGSSLFYPRTFSDRLRQSYSLVCMDLPHVAPPAAEPGLLMLHSLDHGLKEARERVPEMSTRLLYEEVVQAASHRIRPMLKTGLVLLLSLIPVILSHGTGADVIKRIVAPMVGGIVSTLVTVLLILPAVFEVWKSRPACPQRRINPAGLRMFALPASNAIIDSI